MIFLMFALGIEFSLKDLARVRNVAVFGTTLQILLTIGAGVGLGAALGWPFGQGLFFGGILAISSTMVVLKMLLERGGAGRRRGGSSSGPASARRGSAGYLWRRGVCECAPGQPSGARAAGGRHVARCGQCAYRCARDPPAQFERTHPGACGAGGG